MVTSRFDSHVKFLSMPMEIYWAGWRTDTLTLQQAGWELSAEQDIYRAAMRLGVRHRDLQVYGISAPVDFEYQDYYYSQGAKRLPPVTLQYLANRVTVNVHDDLTKFQPFDAKPQFMPEYKIMDIEDFGIWALPMARTEEIIVEPHDVEQLLKMIHDIQIPEQEAIRKNAQLRESRVGMDMTTAEPRQNFHAQIVSIAS